MMNIKKSLISFKTGIFSLVILMLMILTACDKDGDVLSLDQNASISTDEEIIDGYFEDTDDVVLEVNDQIISESGGRLVPTDHLLIRCAVITHDTENNIIIIDFGDGCEGPDGKIRSGKIIITYTNRKLVPGSVWVYTLENYVVNGIALEGTKTLTNVSGEETDNISFNKVLEGGKATWPDGSFATREVNKTFTWIKAEIWGFDEFHVDGEASGLSKNGTHYAMEILETLVYKRECRRQGIHIAVAGIKYVARGDVEVIINYGDGRCDSIVEITRNGLTEEINLRDKKRL